MLESLGNLGEFLSSIAVFASLIYLAIQVKRNTEDHRTSTVLDVLGIGTELNHVTCDSRVSGVIAKLDSDEVLSEEEMVQYWHYMQSWLHQYWQVVYQYERGKLDQDIFEAYARRIPQLFRRGLARKYWERAKFNYPPSFVEFIEKQRAALAADVLW